jgi:hypothetical protein
MGLRLVAHYFNRNEALIVRATLEAAGVPVFVESDIQNSVLPFHEITLGGYRVMVCEEDLLVALAVVDEAVRNRSWEGERLSQRTYFVVTFLLYVFVGLILPFRTSTWHSVDP